MDKRYRVIFYGLKEGRDRFEAQMSQMGARPEIVGELIEKAPVVMKQNMELEEAGLYAEAVLAAGAKVMVQEYSPKGEDANSTPPILSFEHFTMCPHCGFKQPKGKICGKCGSQLSGKQEA